MIRRTPGPLPVTALDLEQAFRRKRWALWRQLNDPRRGGELGRLRRLDVASDVWADMLRRAAPDVLAAHRVWTADKTRGAAGDLVPPWAF